MPPRLGPLLFEQDSVDQVDWAYKRSRSNSRGTTGAGAKTPAREEPPPLPTTKPGEEGPEGPHLGKIDTAVAGKDEAKDNTEVVRSPERKSAGASGPKDEKAGSFFWHSPHSSDGGSSSPKRLEDALDDTKKDKSDEKPKSSQAPLASIKTGGGTPGSNLTSATALGFGGPSDWEHFGDYDAEEVDDIALYTSNKPKTAELPGNESGDADDSADKAEDSGNGLDLPSATDRDVLPTIEERQSEVYEDEAAAKLNGQHVIEDPRASVNSSKYSTDTPRGQGPDQSSKDRASSHADSEPADASRTSSKQEIMIRNDIRSPTTKSPLHQSEEARNSDPPSEVRRSDSNESSGARNDSVQSKNNGVEDSTRANSATVSKRMHSQDRTHTRSDSGFRGFSRQSAVTSTLSSPIDEDDGKENIIISLQVPDSSPSNMSQQPTSPEQRFRDNNQISSPQRTEPRGLTSPEMPQSARRSVFPQSIELEEPYAGLDPWAKASLNRYVKMLREEAQAPSDEEKFGVFVNFTHNETRVRAVLYDMDDESDMSEHPSRHASVKGASSLRPRISVRSKALPALPPKDDVPPVPKTQLQSPAAGTPLSPDAGERGMPKKVNEKASNGALREPNFQSPTARTPGSSEDPFVMIDSPADDKPTTGKQKNTKDKVQDKSKGTPTLSSWKRALEIVSTRTGATTANDPATHANGSQDQVKVNGDPKSAVSETSKPLEDGDGESDVPWSKEGRAYEGDKAANRQTIYRPFSTLLRSTSVRHVSGDSGHDKSKANSPGGDNIQSAGTGRSPRPFDDTKVSRPVNYRYTVLEPLIVVIPQEGVLQQEPAQLVRLRQATDAIPDDFGFIHKTVLAWDAEAKKARERHERERHARVGQNEARIDALFNDHEIGYGDINDLEAEFKRAEAAKKAEEDREEVATFVASVFDVVWARINYEMDQLTPLYEECTALVSAASAGRGMFEEIEGSPAPGARDGSRVPIAPAMDILLVLYQKLMVRHQKAFEAVLERDRRLKKTEVAPWYALGAIEKVKRIEKRFEDAEKKAILEFCRQRDERANLLMDVLDQNTLRGVGANQDYMESIMQAVRKIAADVTRSGGSPRPGYNRNGRGSPNSDGSPPPPPLNADDAVSTEEVLKAKTVTTALARSSEQIVQTFHVADMLLNAADYELSVANAKLSNADAAAFRRLREAKQKEDSKLAMDLEHRMGLIRGDTARTHEEIEKLLGLLAARQERNKSFAAAADAAREGSSAQGASDAAEDSSKVDKDAKGGQRAPAPDEGKRKKKP